MKRIVLPLVLALSFLCAPLLYSDDLGDFKNKVEQEEKENKKADSGQENDNTDDKNNDQSHPFMDFLWQFTFYLWYIHNATAYYAPYPYEQQSLLKGINFIGHDRGSEEEFKAAEPGRKNYYFSFYTTASVNETFHTISGSTRFTGKFFNHMGPEMDYRVFWNGHDFLHLLDAGLNLSVFQFDYMSLDFYAQGSFFFGMLDRQGLSIGAKLTSYPFKPISLEIWSGGIFLESITFAQVEAKLGFLIGRSEIFADFYTLQSKSTSLYSFGIGTGIHF